MDFRTIFLNLDYCSDNSRIILDNNSIKIKPTHFFSYFYRKISPLPQEKIEKREQQNEKTWNIFGRVIRSHINEESCEAEKIFQKITELKEKKADLTAKNVRKFYRMTIASHLQGIRKDAVLARNEELLCDDIEEIKQFYEDLSKYWGNTRVNRALNKYRINPDLLRARDVNKIILAIADYYEEDLQDLWNQIKDVIQDNTTLDTLPTRSLEKLFKNLRIEPKHPKELKERLRTEFGVRSDLLYFELSESQKSLLRSCIFLDEDELELAFQGRKFEGIVDGLIPSFRDNLIRNRSFEDRSRLQLYQTILRIHKSIKPEQFEEFYDEILVKAIVKKELDLGMVIPSPLTEGGRKWYQVSRRLITGEGKLGYHLVEDCNQPNEGKDLLIYRSTSSSPGYLDSWSTVLTGVNPLNPPGYRGKNAGLDQEQDILTTHLDRTLRVVGHSLGGSHAQLFLYNSIKHNEKLNEGKLGRRIEIVSFDSPKLTHKDALSFAKWTEKEGNEDIKNLSITYYVSKGDPAPLVGETYLGDKSRLQTWQILQLSPTDDSSNLYFKSHPHNRFYFQTKLSEDFEIKEILPEEVMSGRWSLIEIIRRVVGVILFPFLYLIRLLTRLILGWEKEVFGKKWDTPELSPTSIG